MYLAESESEKERVRYSIIKSSGLSSTKAKQLYGFKDMGRRIQQVNLAAEKAQQIRVAIEKIARIKEKAIVEELGISLSSETESSESESEEETDYESIIPEVNEVIIRSTSQNDISNCIQHVSNGESCSNLCSNCETGKGKTDLNKNGRY